jgi:hypothetical protein
LDRPDLGLDLGQTLEHDHHDHLDLRGPVDVP